ncbi:MAG: type III-B CRISPR module-associated protein Cmr5 [Clostridiales bacterium]|nr:type III-B CRISPR module-associated protein Cmr5 [Clostridiales bacterium]
MAEKVTVMKGLEQGRASFCYEKVIEAKNKLGDNATDYKSYVKKAPMYIKTNGLGAALAFMKAKGKDGNAWSLIYQQITEWIENDTKALINTGGEDLVKTVVSLETPDYRALTNEVLALFNWLRRFAEGLIKGDD